MELYAFAFLRNLATMRFYGLLWRYMDLWKKANLLQTRTFAANSNCRKPIAKRWTFSPMKRFQSCTCPLTVIFAASATCVCVRWCSIAVWDFSKFSALKNPCFTLKTDIASSMANVKSNAQSRLAKPLRVCSALTLNLSLLKTSVRRMYSPLLTVNHSRETRWRTFFASWKRVVVYPACTRICSAIHSQQNTLKTAVTSTLCSLSLDIHPWKW